MFSLLERSRLAVKFMGVLAKIPLDVRVEL